MFVSTQTRLWMKGMIFYCAATIFEVFTYSGAGAVARLDWVKYSNLSNKVDVGLCVGPNNCRAK